MLFSLWDRAHVTGSMAYMFGQVAVRCSLSRLSPSQAR